MVDGQRVEETESEKLLGVIINNKLSWKDHLYGDKDNSGLVSQLKQRVRNSEEALKVHEQGEVKDDGEWHFLLKTNVLFAGIWECPWPEHLQRQQRKVSRDDSH